MARPTTTKTYTSLEAAKLVEREHGESVYKVVRHDNQKTVLFVIAKSPTQARYALSIYSKDTIEVVVTAHVDPVLAAQEQAADLSDAERDKLTKLLLAGLAERQTQ